VHATIRRAPLVVSPKGIYDADISVFAAGSLK
jgi:hypothetical protein